MRTDRQRRRGEGRGPIGESDGAERVEPSSKVTVPVGVPLPGDTATIVAVKVTAWPETEGFADEVPSGRRCLLDGLGQDPRRAGEEVGVAAVDHGDRVRAAAARSRSRTWPCRH